MVVPERPPATTASLSRTAAVLGRDATQHPDRAVDQRCGLGGMGDHQIDTEIGGFDRPIGDAAEVQGGRGRGHDRDAQPRGDQGVTSVEVSATSWRIRGRKPAAEDSPVITSPITERPCPTWAMNSSSRRSATVSESCSASGWPSGSATSNRSRRNTVARTPGRSTGGRNRAMSISCAASAASWAGASISPRTLTSTSGSSAHRVRTNCGSSEYVAEPTHPMVSCPSVPCSMRRTCRPQQRGEAEPFGVGGGGDHADGGAVVLARRVTRRHRRIGIQRGAHGPQCGECVEVDIGARMFVALDDHVGLAPAAGHRHRDQLLGEAARVVGGDGALMGPQRQLVLRLPGDAVLAA